MELKPDNSGENSIKQIIARIITKLWIFQKGCQRTQGIDKMTLNQYGHTNEGDLGAAFFYIPIWHLTLNEPIPWKAQSELAQYKTDALNSLITIKENEFLHL